MHVRDYVVGHVVEGEVVVDGVLDAVVEAKQVLARGPFCGRLPGLIEDTAGLLVVVDLDLEGFQDRTSDQEGCSSFHDEGLDAAFVAGHEHRRCTDQVEMEELHQDVMSA